MKGKAQGSLEYLLLIGGAIIVAAIVLALVTSLGGAGQQTATSNIDPYNAAIAGGRQRLATNLANNGSFETAGSPPAGWYTYTQPGATYARDSANARTGAYSLSVVSTGTPDGHFGQNGPLPAGTYRLSFWHKTTNGSGNLSVRYCAPGCEYDAGSYALSNTNGNWVKVEKTITATGTLNLWFVRINGFTGTVYFDDFELYAST